MVKTNDVAFYVIFCVGHYASLLRSGFIVARFCRDNATLYEGVSVILGLIGATNAVDTAKPYFINTPAFLKIKSQYYVVTCSLKLFRVMKPNSIVIESKAKVFKPLKYN